MAIKIAFSKIIPTLAQAANGYSFSAQWARLVQSKPVILWGLHYDGYHQREYGLEIDFPASAIAASRNEWSLGHHFAYYQETAPDRITGDLIPTLIENGVRFNEGDAPEEMTCYEDVLTRRIQNRKYTFRFRPVANVATYLGENNMVRAVLTMSDSLKWILQNEN